MMHGAREVGPRHSSWEAGEQSGTLCRAIWGRAKRSGASGAKGGDQGECGPTKHALDSEPGTRVTGAGTHTARGCRHTPKVGAACGKAARADLCGGREATRVPTAKKAHLHRSTRRRGGVAGGGAGAAVGCASNRVPQKHVGECFG